MDSVNRQKIRTLWPITVGTDFEKINSIAAQLVDRYAEGIFGSPVMYTPQAVYDELVSLGFSDPTLSVCEEVYGIH